MGGYNPNSPSRLVVAKEDRFQSSMLNRRMTRSAVRRTTSRSAWTAWAKTRLQELQASSAAKRIDALANGAVRCDRKTPNGNPVLHLVTLRVTLTKTGKRQALLSAINRSAGWNLDEQMENLKIRRAELVAGN